MRKQRKRPWYVDRCVELLNLYLQGDITQRELDERIKRVVYNISVKGKGGYCDGQDDLFYAV